MKLWVALAFLLSFRAFAAEGDDFEKPLPVKFSGFIDTYYAYDFDRPASRDLRYTSIPARNNEFNVNLAYLDAKIDADRIRGRLALQAGTSVQQEYAGEPTVGTVSGATLSRALQEAYLGYRVTDRLWVDAGIYFSHIGLEGWITKDNWAYTHSLLADNSPYYQSGVKATYQWSDALSTQLNLINGWQNISENNDNKALGLQVAYAPAGGVAFTYNDFYGREVGTQPRFYNDFIAKVPLSATLSAAASYDIGFQSPAAGGAEATWQGYEALLRWQLSKRLALTGRWEQYLDPHQIIVTTNTPNGFMVSGASVNADVALHRQVQWRTEVRALKARDSIFPLRSSVANADAFVVSSLSAWF